jgi:hypothetical protein
MGQFVQVLHIGDHMLCILQLRTSEAIGASQLQTNYTRDPAAVGGGRREALTELSHACYSCCQLIQPESTVHLLHISWGNSQQNSSKLATHYLFDMD